ncbi:differentially expressed in FDCP 6 homolog [Chanos chanos]|uniref:Differentially expressed in FDCP 6 homolog n=1 Tax=Chanos chanos TaxID=29144 RepID=A0A6J2VKY9_CHACN|nr:differentially expressed in FDCP 6 homolog [Chanos chanos]
MDLRTELLKSIWYAFTSLDAEHHGKVSKSQLKVLSHNLYTALNIPHDPVALEQHFQDDDNGPVSSQGYMPYLNNYILSKAKEGTFDKETFDDLCWMMTSKKNYKPSIEQGLCSERDCFKLFCLFNLLSEDHYPLVIIPAEVKYLLKKISTAMNQEWNGKLLEDLLSKKTSFQGGMSVWDFLEYVNAGQLMQTDNREVFSLALDDVFREMYHNVLKKGYMLKKGHVRRNWQERWFVLKPSSMAYYVNEDLKEKKGEIQLDKTCVVETLPDKEGKRYLFCVKTPGRTYEMNASDQKMRLEWIQAVQTAIRLTAEGKSSLHQELKLQRREQREICMSDLTSQQEDTSQFQLQEERGKPGVDIDTIIQNHKEMEIQRKEREEQDKQQQKELCRELERQLEDSKKAEERMVADMAMLERKVEQQKQTIQDLVLTKQKLEEALKNETQAHLEEKKERQKLERQLAEERRKLAELLQKLPTENNRQETPQLTEEDSSVSSTSCVPQPAEHPQTLTGTENTSQVNLQESLYDYSQQTKHWNIQLNRLLKPITPGDKVPRVKPSCPKQGQALVSSEFITKYQSAIDQETPQPFNQPSNTEEEASPVQSDQARTSVDKSNMNSNGQGDALTE